MNPTAPAWKPQINPSDPDDFWARPAVRATLRALYVVAGVAVAAAALVVVGFYAALFGCFGVETDGLCASASWLVPWLEWPIFLTAVIAPLAGGIVSYRERTPLWLCCGVLTSVGMAVLIALVSSGQTSALS